MLSRTARVGEARPARPGAAFLAAGALALDICLVLAFVIIGRASHHAAGGLAGTAGTAWPFLTGLAAGELAGRFWRRPIALVPAGVSAWLGTVAVGMTLRVAAGQGIAAAFVAVALAFVGLFLLGWRAAVAAAVAPRRKAHQQAPLRKAHRQAPLRKAHRQAPRRKAHRQAPRRKAHGRSGS